MNSTLPPGKYKKLDNFLYSETDVLGKGCYGTVYKAYDSSQDNLPVAVKVMSTALVLKDEDELKSFMRELEILKQIVGKHFVQLLRGKETKNHVYIFMEYCDQGDLAGLIKTRNKLEEDEALEILYQITEAFLSLNSLVIKNRSGQKVAVMHRDVKPANILFSNGVLKIADFGYAKMVDESTKNKKNKHTYLGSPLYTSPQILSGRDYSVKCDVWSVACVFYECLCGYTPWTGNSIAHLYQNIMETPLEIPKGLSKESEDLLIKMLEINEEDRLDWEQVSAHPALGKRVSKKKQ